MTKEIVKVAIADGKTMSDVAELPVTGQPVRIKAVPNGKYVLAQGEKGVAPETVTVKRVGKDLHVTLEGGDPDQPQLIIEGFYETQGQLVGMAEDGSFHEFIATDAVQDHNAAFLIEGVSSPQVLGVETVSGMNGMTGMSGGVFGTGIGMLGAGLIGLAGLGLVGAAVAAGKDDDKKDDSPPALKAPDVSATGDDVGSETGPLVSGGTTDDTTPTFSGVGTPGNTIVVKDGDKVIGETLIGDDGKWTFTPEPLGEGAHDVVFIEKDRVGNEGPPSPGFEIIIDLQAPAQAVINSVQDDVDVPEPIVQNGKTNDSTPTLNGQAEPGATVEIFANGVKLGTAPVGADGTWSFTPTALQDDTYSFTVVAVDAAGNRGLPSDPFVFSIDTALPGTPGQGGNAGIGHVIDDNGDEISAGGSTNDNTPTFTGSGQEPGTTVTLRDETGAVIGETVVDASGNWSVTPGTPLSDENHEIVMTIKDPAGNESLPSDPFVIVVDTAAPGTPGQDGNPGIGQVVNDKGDVIPEDGSTNDTTPTFSGSGQTPGETITLYDGSTVIGTVEVDASGNWAITPDIPLAEGDHPITTTVTDKAGNESAPSAPYDVIVDTTAPGTPGQGGNPGIGQVVNDNGDVIPEDGTTNDTTPTFSGSGQTPGETITLYDGSTVIGTVEVDASGNWAITPDVPLAEGDHPITTTITDKAGNESAPSDPYDVTVDTTAPGTPGQGGNPGIGQVVNDNGDEIPAGSSTNDNTPTFTGSGQEPGSTVILRDENGAVIGEGVVDPAGNWSVTPGTPLSDQDHEIVMTVKDPSGNESLPSDPYVIIVDTVAPGTPGQNGNGGIDTVRNDLNPTAIDIANGESTNDTTPTIVGSNQQPGDTVTIYNGTDIIGTTTVLADGTWAITPSTALTEATYAFTMTVTDQANNVSLPSAPYVVTIDTTAPGIPGQGGNPGIGQVVNDNGDVIPEDGSTNDTTPTFSGSGQTPGETVTLYDGTTVIGTAEVDASGNWAITPGSPLSNADHDITMTVTDPAGNESLPSDPYTITVDTIAPVAQATIVSMDRDSGTAGDFVTNDGTAGRTVSGTLTAALATDEKVQVSLDGGMTWQDAIVDGAGGWTFVDNNAHTTSWEIKARIVDAAGNSGAIATQQVKLDTTVAAATLISWDGAVIHVEFAPAGMAPGDTIQLTIDGVVTQHTLTAAEISTGVAEVPYVGVINDAPEEIRVSLIDSAGNVSDDRVLDKNVSPAFSENFNGQSDVLFVTGQTYVLTDFTITAVEVGAGAWNTGFGRQLGSGDRPTTTALELGSSGAELHIDITSTTPVNTVSMTVGDLSVAENLTAIFYDDAGNVVFTQTLTAAGGLTSEIVVELPYGTEFSSFDLVLANGPSDTTYVWIDNIEFGHYDYVASSPFDSGVVATTAANTGNNSLTGDDSDFSIADVALLDNSNAGLIGDEGLNSLTLNGAAQVLDLTNIAGKLESIEIIDITGTGNNTLTLSLEDVLDQGQTSLFTSDNTVQMMVKGNAGDVVNLDDQLAGTDPGDWSNSGTVDVGGVTYNVFSHSTVDAELLVQQGVTTNLV